ncbi:MAG TPA: hypothetical protein VNW97_21535 [Candidatus Saccharimonadales bacterium]|nr:hypothetical protein [Candidatus Saccharimonadales bacterium]
MGLTAGQNSKTIHRKGREGRKGKTKDWTAECAKIKDQSSKDQSSRDRRGHREKQALGGETYFDHHSRPPFQSPDQQITRSPDQQIFKDYLNFLVPEQSPLLEC